MAVRRPRNSPSPASRTFTDLGVPAALTEVLTAGGIATPFPIQAATLPDALAGRDVLGRGCTGSGKTLAFALPVLTRLAGSGSPRRPGRPRALILAPTRELAAQIEATISPLADAMSLSTLTVFGGVSPTPQVSGLREGVDILVACPGRLTDHVTMGHARLDAVEITVVDEADHMADLGFLPDVRRLLEQTPSSGQRLLFSATLDAAVDVLVRRFLRDPAVHNVDSSLSPVTAMSHHVLHVSPQDRMSVLVELTAAPGRTLVFTRTKRGAKALTRRLVAAGVPAVELHGNLAQTARSRNLLAFADGTARTLVATDVAARGIHVDNVTLVIHADPPVEHKAYLHRSGRTARAGAAGTVVTLITDDQIDDVRELARKAGIAPTTTRLRPGDPLLTRLAPGQRSYVRPRVPSPTAIDTSVGGHSRRNARRPSAATPGTGSKLRQAASPPRPASSRRDRPQAEASARPSGAAAFSARTRVAVRRGNR